ncbi:MAG: coiled-coil domain-containing protein, partial [Thermoplasmatota archaeon]
MAAGRTAALSLILIVGIVILTALPNICSANKTTTNEDAVGELSGKTFTVWLRWTDTSEDWLRMYLYHNDELVAETNHDSHMHLNTSYIYKIPLSHEPAAPGSYRVDIWSEKENKVTWSMMWRIPSLQLELAVTPASGSTDTEFTATASLSTTLHAPDAYSVQGVVELNTSETIFRQSLGGMLCSPHYFEFNGLPSNFTPPFYVSTVVRYSVAGSHMMTAQYSDAITTIAADPREINVTPSANSELEKLKSDMNSTHEEMALLLSELNSTQREMALLLSELNSTRKNLSSAEKEIDSAKGQASSAMLTAYAGVSLGIVGMVLGLAGIMMSRRGRAAPTPPVPPPPSPQPAIAPLPAAST